MGKWERRKLSIDSVGLGLSDFKIERIQVPQITWACTSLIFYLVDNTTESIKIMSTVKIFIRSHMEILASTHSISLINLF